MSGFFLQRPLRGNTLRDFQKQFVLFLVSDFSAGNISDWIAVG